MTFQNFKATLKLMKEAFFRHSEKNALRSCIKAINFCTLESQGELQDFARNQLKQLEDELVSKVKSAIKEVEVSMLLDFSLCLISCLLLGLAVMISLLTGCWRCFFRG